MANHITKIVPLPKPKPSTSGYVPRPKGLNKLDPHIGATRVPGEIRKLEVTHDVNGREISKREIDVPRTLDDCRNGEIVDLGRQLGVAKVSHEQGRGENAQLYSEHIRKLGEAAALVAIEEAFARLGK